MKPPLPDKPTRVTAYATAEHTIVEFGSPGDADYERISGKPQNIWSAILRYLSARFNIDGTVYKLLDTKGHHMEIWGRPLLIQHQRLNTSEAVIQFVTDMEQKLREIVNAQFANRVSKPLSLPEVASAAE